MGVIRFTGVIHTQNTAIRRLVEKAVGTYEASWVGDDAVEVTFDLPTGKRSAGGAHRLEA